MSTAPAGFSEVFGGGLVQPANQLYVPLGLTAPNLALFWPVEATPSSNVIGDLMDVTPSAFNQTIQLPDATQGPLGATSLINNVSATFPFNVLDANGNVVLSAAVGTTWLLYLTNNTTSGGIWRALQIGVNAASVNLPQLAGAGLQVINQALAEAMPNLTIAASYSSSVLDLATTFIWNGSTGTFTPPPVGTLSNVWFIKIVNGGTGVLTFSPPDGALIDNSASKQFAIGGSAFVFTDGSNWWSLGYGVAGSGTGFGYITVALPASGTYALSGGQLNQVSYLLTGALTGDVTLQVPASVQEYWINNQTTGGHNVIVSSVGGGSTFTVPQGTAAILYCDSANVINAVSSTSLTIPVTVAQGGTGATSSSAALTNLGGSSVGKALFTTASANAALATLGVGTEGLNVFVAVTHQALWAALVNTATPGTSSGMYLSGGALRLVNQGVVWGTVAGQAPTFNGAVSAFEPNYGVTGIRPVPTVSTASFNAPCTGITGVSTIPCQYTRCGPLVMLQIAVGGNVTGTGTGTTFSINIPGEIVPNTRVFQAVADGAFEDNSVSLTVTNGHAGAAIIAPSSPTLSFIKDNSSASWVAGGTRGIITAPITICYSLL